MRNLILPSLQGSEVYIEAEQSLESIGRAAEMSLESRAKDSLHPLIDDKTDSLALPYLI